MLWKNSGVRSKLPVAPAKVPASIFCCPTVSIVLLILRLFYQNNMKITEVTTQKHIKEFLLLPARLYKNSRTWIRPLDKDVESVFDREKNKTFRHGECVRWILLNDAGETIGRVAAFVNQKTVNKGNEQPTGGMGFFECIQEQKAAFMLFDQCKNWLQARGMEAMDGPINFGNRDRWWGLL